MAALREENAKLRAAGGGDEMAGVAVVAPLVSAGGRDDAGAAGQSRTQGDRRRRTDAIGVVALFDRRMECPGRTALEVVQARTFHFGQLVRARIVE